MDSGRWRAPGGYVFLGKLGGAEEALKRLPDCKLLVIDPIGSFLGGDADAHWDNEVTRRSGPSREAGRAIWRRGVDCRPPPKDAGANADEGTLGSRAFTGIARAVWHLSRDPENKDRRLLLPGKNNLSKEGTGLAFTIDGTPPRIWWEDDPISLSADEGLAAEHSIDRDKPGPEPAARTAAMEWLRKLLKNGAVDAGKVREESKGAGLVYKTVQRAADALDVVREPGFGGKWTWELPPSAHLDKHLDKHPLTINNLSTCPDGKTQQKEEEKPALSREVDKLFSVGGKAASSPDPGMRYVNGEGR